MAIQLGYLIIDIGTGNVRVGLSNTFGELIGVERDNVNYLKDNLYPDALSFNPDELWSQIVVLIQRILKNHPNFSIQAITATSQREGIVIMNSKGDSLIGLPNHDHRGREWESEFSKEDKEKAYKIAGRYPSSLFSAMKIIGIKNRRSDIYNQMASILSISDWAQFKFTGVLGYEHSQASETLLYDVRKKEWSDELCYLFNINKSILPPLRQSGSLVGSLSDNISTQLNINPEAVVLVGGADTQLAIKSTQPALNNIVIVSGTTTPVVKLIKEYKIDEKFRTWTNRHVDDETFILETNAGVTGLNYQRLKEIFYPNEDYSIIENELQSLTENFQCVASLGSLISDEKQSLKQGGFIFEVPISHQLSRVHFVWAALWDIACSIKENLDCLAKVDNYQEDYFWGCGGGFQSSVIRQVLASLTNKKIFIREGYNQASVSGGSMICNEYFGINHHKNKKISITYPQNQAYYHSLYLQWKTMRSGLRELFNIC